MTEAEGAQEWSAEWNARNARLVAELGGPVVDWLDAQPRERVLDVGCGDGALTASIVARGAEVVGVDSSASLVRAACARGIDAHLIDARFPSTTSSTRCSRMPRSTGCSSPTSR